MKFINRDNEMSYLMESKNLADNKLFAIAVYGLRRIGKTKLILQFMHDKDLYFFVNKDKTSGSLLIEFEEVIRKKGLLTKMETLKNWEDFFKILFERYNGVVAFDEFQNFMFVEKSVFGILQKCIDLNENRKELLFIFSGSLIGMMKTLFSDAKEPLYGRLKRQMQLKPLSFLNTIKMCEELNIKDFSGIISLYSVFGGFPKYYVSIEDENLEGKKFEEILERLFFTENANLENEITNILSLEFGKRSGIYYDILTAIANGCTRISEIASFLRKKETDLTRQINELIYYFEIIKIEKQLIGNKKIMIINHQLMNFWFKFFYKNLSDYKRREKWLIDKIKNEQNTYIGKGFEDVCREFLIELNTSKKLPFQFEKIGRQWGKFKGEKGKNTYEIDLCALGEKEILFAECKWREKVDAKRIFEQLKEKAGYVQWNNNDRKEYYAIFAKSFKSKIKEPNLLLFDLKDMEKMIKSGLWVR